MEFNAEPTIQLTIRMCKEVLDSPLSVSWSTTVNQPGQDYDRGQTCIFSDFIQPLVQAFRCLWFYAPAIKWCSFILTLEIHQVIGD